MPSLHRFLCCSPGLCPLSRYLLRNINVDFLNKKKNKTCDYDRSTGRSLNTLGCPKFRHTILYGTITVSHHNVDSAITVAKVSRRRRNLGIRGATFSPRRLIRLGVSCQHCSSFVSLSSSLKSRVRLPTPSGSPVLIELLNLSK